MRVYECIIILCIKSINSLENLKVDWNSYKNKLIIPEIIDLRNGGNLNMEINTLNHNWTNNISGMVYGYGILDKNITYPGPTILVSKNQPINVNWINKLNLPHILEDNVENSFLIEQSACYPKCGIPTSVHVHGLEVPAKYDGIFTSTIYSNNSLEVVYSNNQNPSTKVYHDHSLGLSRLNVWSGLIGLYIISDDNLENKLKVNIEQDIPLIIQDRLINTDGKLLYSDEICPETPNTKWVPEAFGNVNVVNGIIIPYIEVKPEQVRFRIVNGANARHYNMTISFANNCHIIATDSGFVQIPKVSSEQLVLFPLERIELICDFSSLENNIFNITDTNMNDDTDYNENILQIRILSKTNNKIIKKIADRLNAFKDLKELYILTNGKERNITLGESKLTPTCPTQSLLKYNNNTMDMHNITKTIGCVKGTVEKWYFRNPTDDPHPFHWHLVSVQCGPSDDEIDTNILKDIAVIPNDDNHDENAITQICYVACTPDEYLNLDSDINPADFKFDTSEPYVAHCHILEHEENSMMAWFKIIDNDINTNSLSITKIPNTNDKSSASSIFSNVVYLLTNFIIMLLL